MAYAATCPSLQTTPLNDPLRFVLDNTQNVRQVARRSQPMLRPKRVAERYTFVRTINEGSTATVYEARHNFTGLSVAIKKVKKSESARAVVLNERAMLSGLNHPNIARLIDFEENDDCYLIVQVCVCVCNSLARSCAYVRAHVNCVTSTQQYPAQGPTQKQSANQNKL